MIAAVTKPSVASAFTTSVLLGMTMLFVMLSREFALVPGAALLISAAAVPLSKFSAPPKSVNRLLGVASPMFSLPKVKFDGTLLTFAPAVISVWMLIMVSAALVGVTASTQLAGTVHEPVPVAPLGAQLNVAALTLAG